MTVKRCVHHDGRGAGGRRRKGLVAAMPGRAADVFWPVLLPQTDRSEAEWRTVRTSLRMSLRRTKRQASLAGNWTLASR